MCPLRRACSIQSEESQERSIQSFCAFRAVAGAVAAIRMPPLPPSAIPENEKRLQSANIHRQFVENGVYPDTRKMLMQQHATRAAQFEYLPPGGEQAKFDFPKPGKRVHSVYDAVAKEAEKTQSSVRMVRNSIRPLIFWFLDDDPLLIPSLLLRAQVMMDGRWRMMGGGDK